VRAVKEKKRGVGGFFSRRFSVGATSRAGAARGGAIKRSKVHCSLTLFYICLLFSLRSSVISVIRAGVAINWRVKGAALRTASRAAS